MGSPDDGIDGMGRDWGEQEEMERTLNGVLCQVPCPSAPVVSMTQNDGRLTNERVVRSETGLAGQTMAVLNQRVSKSSLSSQSFH